MPSPLPGMDPFLETPDRFPTFHANFITYMQEWLQSRLPDAYSAGSEERAYIETENEREVLRQIVPDVTVRSRDPIATGETVALADPAVAEPLTIVLNDIEIKEHYLSIYHGQHPDERLVAIIELLSPSNKTVGHVGRDLYLQKQREILHGGVHLIEIDLLRSGKHTTAVPLSQLRRKAGEVPYHVCVRAFDTPLVVQVYPIGLRQKLPTIRIPLLPGDGFVRADLQAIFNRTYDAGPFRKRIRYASEELTPPLSDTDAAWVRECVQTATTH